MRTYVDSCRTYEILLQDSGLLAKPTETWNVFVPEKGMIAHVDDDGDYQFDGTQWVKMLDEEEVEEGEQVWQIRSILKVI